MAARRAGLSHTTEIPPVPRRSRRRAVLLDAYGTLLRLPPPAPRLRELLAAAGHPHPLERVEAAVAAEVRHYRRRHDRGRDAGSLAALRRECAAVIAVELAGDVPALDPLAQMLVASLRFELMADALPALDALDARGARLAVVSNWDCGLPDVLAGLGVADRFAAIVTSATVGAAKPEPAIFIAALEGLRVAPGLAIHCGDSPVHDCAGARACGIEAVLIDREGRAPDGPCRKIGTLPDLANMMDE